MAVFDVGKLKLMHRITGAKCAYRSSLWLPVSDETVTCPEPVDGGVYSVIGGSNVGAPYVVMRDGKLHALSETGAMNAVHPEGIAARAAALDAYIYRETRWKGPAPLGMTRSAVGGRIVTKSSASRHFWRRARPEEIAAYDAEQLARDPSYRPPGA